MKEEKLSLLAQVAETITISMNSIELMRVMRWLPLQAGLTKFMVKVYTVRSTPLNFQDPSTRRGFLYIPEKGCQSL